MSERLPSPPRPAKVCIRCGIDCSSRPRVKDAKGRYMCQPCEEVWSRGRAGVAAAHGSAAAGAASAEDPIFGLGDEPGAGYALADAIPDVPVQAQLTCMQCGVLMPAGALLCTRCGWDSRTGQSVGIDLAAPEPEKKKRDRARRCEGCGYDLTGLKHPKCPECGRVFKVGRDYRQELQDDSRRIARMEYLKPLLLLGGALAVMLVILGGQWGSVAVGNYLVRFGASVPVGVAAFWICCLMFFGFDAPMHLTALRLAAIYAVVDIVWLASAFVPLFLISWAIPALVFVVMVSQLMDLEVVDAIILGLVTFVAKMTVALAIFYMQTGGL